MYTSCVLLDGNNGAEQTFVMNITNLPPGGANYRVAKTVANGNWFNGNAQPLVLGLNTITVASVIFDRIVKFQFSSGAVEFDELSSNGNLLYSSIPTQTFTNAAGCDSVVTLDLTLSISSTGIDVIQACDAYTWIDGNMYTVSNNIATHTLTNTVGCDSIVSLDLTINNSNTEIDFVTACDSYTWIDGNTYTASNNSATHTLSNASGCDSIVSLDLTINNSNTGIDVVTACDSYTWIDGNTYTARNNRATHTLSNP